MNNDDPWIRFGDKKQSSSFTGNLSGKYLFFSSDIDSLKDVVNWEIKHHGFSVAKISKEKTGSDHVLCLYWHDDSRKHELAARYKNSSLVKYRYWKSNDDTRKGKYSKLYVNNVMNKYGRNTPMDRELAKEKLKLYSREDILWLKEECAELLGNYKAISNKTVANFDDGWNGDFDAALAQYENDY